MAELLKQFAGSQMPGGAPGTFVQLCGDRGSKLRGDQRKRTRRFGRSPPGSLRAAASTGPCLEKMGLHVAAGSSGMATEQAAAGFCGRFTCKLHKLIKYIKMVEHLVVSMQSGGMHRCSLSKPPAGPSESFL